MAVKFLDYTGLGYFWSKIKAWCNATFAAITHNQASNTINAMTSYSKPSSGSAIATSDSLNTAIGKLEAKVDAVDDSNYVHKTGDETIEGTKRFKPNYVITSDTDAGSSIVIKSSSYSRTGTSIKRYNWFGLYFEDKDNNSLVQDTYNYFPGRVGCLEHFCDTQGTVTYIRLLCSKGSYSAGTADETTGLITGFDSNGTKFARAPSTSENRSHNEDIITRDWIPKDTRIVHTTGNESIAGDKTFTYNMFIKHPSATRGTAPSSNLERDIYFYDSVGNKIATFGSIYYTDKSSRNAIYAYNTTVATGNNIGYLGIGCDKDGNVFTHAPTPATSSNDTNIATTAFVKAQGYLTSHQSLTNYVTLSTNQTITGVKTFYERGERLRIKNPHIAKGDAPSSTNYSTIAFYDNSATDSLATRFGFIENFIEQGTGKNVMRIGAYKNVSGSTDLAVMDLWCWPDGTSYVLLPTPSADSNKNVAATTEWVRSFTGNATIGNSSDTGWGVTNGTYTLRFMIGGSQVNRGLYDSTNSKWMIYSNASETIVNGRCTGTASNVTGTVAIANGGTGATTRLNAVKALTNESVGTSAQFFLTITNSWGKAGYTTVTDAKTVLGLKSAAYTESSAYATASHTHSQYLTSHQSLANYVTLDGSQTITGSKNFSWFCTKSTVIDRTITNTTSDNWLISGGYQDKNGKALIDVGFHRAADRNWSLRLYDASGTQHWLMFQGMKHDGTSPYVSVGGDFYTMDNGAKYCGLSGNRWKAVYAVNGSIQTSDERIKEDIDKLPEAVLDAWESIEWLQFRMKPSVEKKGDSARLHSGIIAQRARDAFTSVGLDASDYGFFCWDQWDKTPAVFDEKGDIAIPETPAGDQYSIRYDEALAIEAAYQRRKNKILENRISELEKQVSDMLQILQSLKGAN